MEDGKPESKWLKIAREADSASTDFLDTNYRKQWERSVANFQSRHPVGSKYLTKNYVNRSRLFRPKTRAAVRKNEIALVSAIFSTSDIVTTTAEDQKNESQRQAADLHRELLQYRLEKTIPWLKLCVGGFQETQVYGVVVSRQSWKYEEKEITHETDEGPIKLTVKSKDEPNIKLIEIENFRFDPAADWADVVGTSPYLIEYMPMYVDDVLERMEKEDPKTGQPEWHQYTKEEVLAAGREKVKDDTTRQAREHKKTDSKDVTHTETGFSIVWIHRNIVRQKGEDYIYYTIGTEKMLTDPVPLSEVSPIGRDYVAGTCVIEAHKIIPAAPVEQVQDLQAAANVNQNLRLDNIEQVLNKRKLALRDRNVDWNALLTAPIGGIVLTDDLEAVKEEATADMTRSSYEEQNRLNVDFDELIGGFSTSSVQTNRELGETVGGMNLLSQHQVGSSEYYVRVFVETWVKPVLYQIVQLEQEYETDAVILALAGQRAKLEAEPDDELLRQNVTLRVNVGYGALNPQQRVEKILYGMTAVGQVAPNKLAQVEEEEVVKEVFGALGYEDGGRFFKDEEVQQGPSEAEIQMQVEQMKIQSEENKEAARIESAERIEAARIQAKTDLKMADLALKEKLTLEQLYNQLDIDETKTDLDVLKELGRREDQQVAREEMQLKRETGEGI